MGRWSPTVVAEAPQRGPGLLSVALQSGLNQYDALQRRRMQRQELDQAQQRIDEERSWRDLQQQRWKRDDEMTSAKWAAELQGEGWSETDPSQAGGVGGSESLDPRPYPAWYKDEQDRIKAEANRLYPGSGVVSQRDPISGRTMYLPVRERFIRQEEEKLRARLREEEKARQGQANQLHVFEQQEKIRLQNDLIRDRERARLSPRMTSGAAGVDPSKNVAAQYDDELATTKAQIDDVRAEANIYGTMARNADAAMQMAGVRSANAQQLEAINRMKALQARLAQLQQSGVDGFARARADQELGREIATLSEQLAPLLQRPDITPAEKQALLAEFQKASDHISKQNRTGLQRARSPLAKQLQPR